MFYKVPNLWLVDLTGISIEEGADMREMFYGCEKLRHVICAGFPRYGNKKDILKGCKLITDSRVQRAILEGGRPTKKSRYCTKPINNQIVSVFL